MKIVMLGHKRIPSREGGVEIVVEELAVRMAQQGHNITVYNRKGHHVSGAENDSLPEKQNEVYKGVKIKTVFTLPNKSLNAIVYSFFAALRACVSGADVVHFHAEGPCSMIPLVKVSGRRCVATIHGLDWQRAKWGGFATRFLLFGEKMAAKYADEIIVLSKSVQEYFKTTYNRDTVFIPNGIEKPVRKKADEITSVYGLKEDEYLLFLARLVPEKGAHTLIEAYKNSNVSIPLVIAGGSSHSGDYEQEIKELAEAVNEDEASKKTGKKIILTGFIQGNRLEELYSNALVYILPSEIEGMPLSLLEALSYGNLCLTSDIEENTSVTGSKGFSFKSRDAQSLKEELENLVLQTNNLRLNGFSREEISGEILKRFNWDEVVRATLECYENVSKKSFKG